MFASVRSFVLVSLAAAATAGAQQPGPAAQPTSVPRAAQMLLAQTGPLDLTDAQVVKLAAIARRSEARRRGMRAAMDSARDRFSRSGAADSTARRQFRDRMRADMERAREQSRNDQRDAIAVLTADQQARAWEMVARRGRATGMRGERGPRMRRNMRPRMERRFDPRGGFDRRDQQRPPRPPTE